MPAIEGIGKLIEEAPKIAKFVPEALKGAEATVKDAIGIGEKATKATGEAAKVSEDAVKGAETAAKDAGKVGKFGGIKTLAEGGIGGAVLGEAAHLLGEALGGAKENEEEGNSADDDLGIPPASGSSGSSGGGSNEPPPASGSSAAEPQEPSSVNRKRSGISSDKDSILEILREILNVQTESLAELQIGFRSLFQAFQQNTNSIQQQMMGNLVQQESKSASSSGSSSQREPIGMFGRMGEGIKGVATTLGITAAVGALLTVLPKSLWGGKDDSNDSQQNSTKSPSGSTSSDSSSSSTTQTKQPETKEQKVIDEYRSKYGEDKYAEVLASRIIGEYMKANRDNPKVKAESQKDLAVDQFGLVMKLYNMLDKNGKEQIVALLANLNHMKTEDVEHMIHVQSSPGMKMIHGIEAGLNRGTLATFGGVAKLANYAVGGVSEAIGTGMDYFGANGDALHDYAHHEFSTVQKRISDWEKKRYFAFTSGAALGQGDSTAAKITDYSTQAALALVGMGGAGAVLKGAAMAGGVYGAIGDDKKFGYDGITDEAINAAVGGGGGNTPGAVASVKHSGRKLSEQAKQRANQAISFFMSKGFTKEQAEGIVSNLLVESNYTLDPHQAQIGGGGGYGIAQWTSKGRKRKFEEIEGTKLENSTFEQQLDFINWELNNTEKVAGNKLKAQQTVEGASEVITQYYERPAAIDQQSSFRASYAMELSRQLQGTQTTPTMTAETTSPTPSTYGSGSPVVVADNSTGAVTVNAPSNIMYPSAAAPVALRAAQG